MSCFSAIREVLASKMELRPSRCIASYVVFLLWVNGCHHGHLRETSKDLRLHDFAKERYSSMKPRAYPNWYMCLKNQNSVYISEYRNDMKAQLIFVVAVLFVASALAAYVLLLNHSRDLIDFVSVN
jgi:hypothetical protein